MLLVSYDISNDRLRAKFSKFLKRFGYRLQYSLFEIKNSARILALIKIEITDKFSKRFSETDSVIIFELSSSCKITKFGYANHEDEDLIII